MRRILFGRRINMLLLFRAAALLLPFIATFVANSQSPTELDPHGKRVPATMAHMYRYVFQVQNSLERLAADREKHGVSGTQIRESLRTLLGMSEEEFASFENSAVHFGKQERHIEERIRNTAQADIGKHPKIRALSNDARTAVHTMAGEAEEMLDDELSTVHEALGSDVSARLDAAVTRFYAQGQQNVIQGQRLTDASSKVSSQFSSSGQHPVAAVTKPTVNPSSAEGDPGCTTSVCNLPISSTQMMFTADGTTVIGVVQAAVSQDDSDNGCWPDVTLDLNQNGSPVVSGEADSWYLTASVSVFASVNVGSEYNLSGYVESCNDDQACNGASYNSTGFTTGPPSISSVSVSSDVLGGSGTIQVTGYDLGGPPGNTPTISVDGSGLSVNASGPASYSGSSQDLSYGTASLDYSISPSATTGADSYTINTVWGTSSPSSFSVYCGSPQITNVSPSNWDAGVTYNNVNILGSGFCSASSLTVSVPTGSVGLSNVTFVDSQTITATVKPADTDPTETAVVTVSTSADSLAGARPDMASKNAATLGGGSSTYNAMVTSTIGQVYLVDPYLFLTATNSSGSIDPGALIAQIQSNYSGIQAKGILTDGTATAIAVYRSLVNAPVYFSGSVGLGLSFAPWNSSFLSSAPTSGTATLGPVSPLQQAGGYYYSFALVVAPPQSSLYATMFPVADVYAGPALGVVGTPASMAVRPTPVLFVHGLWGSGASLSHTINTLGGLSPWAGTDPLGGNALRAICYSKYLAFNAPGSDTVSETCQMTSTEALDAYFKQLNVALDSAHFVGGRVDLVGHSMGGLVARYYSSLPQYNSNRTFAQGLFRTVVTIDTPEQGSALATDLLVNEAQRTCGKQTTPTSSNLCVAATGEGFSAQLFSDLCGAPGTTMAQCFQSLGLPLGPPGSVSGVGGAVWSLEPGCSSINSLPSPNIPGSRWVAINSDYSDSASTSCSQGSLLRLILNGLLTSTYSTNPPNLSGILGTTENDVIVTIPSQTTAAGAVPAMSIPYQCLAHSHVPFGTLAGLIMNASDANVTLSSSVDNSVACALTPTLAICSNSASTSEVAAVNEARALPSSTPANPGQSGTGTLFKDEADARLVDLLKHPKKLTPERMKLSTESLTVPLGSPFEVTVDLAPGELYDSVHAGQRGVNGYIDDGTTGEAKVVRDEGDAKTIEITPLELGAVNLTITVIYMDNGYATQTLHLNVVPSAKGLKKFSLMAGLSPHHTDMVMADAERDRREMIQPVLSFDGLSRDIYPSLDQLNYSVDQPQDDPVISLTKWGLITALRPGKAVIKAEYAGITDQVTVNVYSKEDAPMNWRETHAPLK